MDPLNSRKHWCEGAELRNTTNQERRASRGQVNWLRHKSIPNFVQTYTLVAIFSVTLSDASGVAKINYRICLQPSHDVIWLSIDISTPIRGGQWTSVRHLNPSV
jgi:hypothetical protein